MNALFCDFSGEIRQDTSFQAQLSRKRVHNTHLFGCNPTDSALHFENLENRLVLKNRNTAG